MPDTVPYHTDLPNQAQEEAMEHNVRGPPYQYSQMAGQKFRADGDRGDKSTKFCTVIY